MWKRRPRHKGGGREVRTYPLFPRYVFVECDRQQLSYVFGHKHVIEVLGNDEPLALPEKIVSDLRAAVVRGDFDDILIRTRKLNDFVGRRVELLQGAFAGLPATVSNVGKRTAQLDLIALGGTITLTVPTSELGVTVVEIRQDDPQKQSAQRVRRRTRGAG